MKKKMKKVCAGILCATLALTLTTPVTKGLMKPDATASADVQYDGDFVYKNKTFRFVYYGTGVRILSVKEQGGELEVPSEINYKGIKRKVISIGEGFGQSQSFRMVKIPNTVTRIENYVLSWSIVEKIVLSDNLEQIGSSFCRGATVSKIECSSKKIRNIKPYVLCDAKCPSFMNISNWIVKYDLPRNTTYIDLTAKEWNGMEHTAQGAIHNTNIKTTIKVSSRYADRLELLNGSDLSSVKYIQLDGNDIVCNKASDVIPEAVGKHYKYIANTPFAISYFDKKARLVLNSIGVTYYGMNNNKVGKLSASKEYDICLKIHDYIVNNYIYDTRKCCFNFFGVFSTKGATACQTDAGMFASLAEAAGVDAEVCYNGSNGAHCWNVVTVGGQKYYIDTTWDRQIDSYRWFLCSNKTMNSDTSELHHDIKYTNYGTGEWDRKRDFYANRNLCGKPVVECRITNGDLNMDCVGGTSDDFALLNVYMFLDDDIKKKCQEAKDGIVLMSDSEFARLNSESYNGKTYMLGSLICKGTVRLLFDPKVVDIDFDGSVTSADIVALMKMQTHPIK